MLLFLFFLFLCCVMDEGLIVHVLVGDIRDPHTNVRDVCFCSILTVLLCVNPQGKDVQLSEWVTEENSNLVVLPLMMMMMVVTFLEVIVITFFPRPSLLLSLCSLDVRGVSLAKGIHWSSPDIFGPRARFNIDADVPALEIEVSEEAA